MIHKAGGKPLGVAEHQQLEISFHSDIVPKNIPKDISLCPSRVLQEVVQNAIKHSGSRHLDVSLRATANGLESEVRDCGIGFEPIAITTGKGLGFTEGTAKAGSR